MGFFSLLFLLLFIGFLLYFCGGMLMLRLRGASGLETVPHLAFWLSLPGRAKVGKATSVSYSHALTPLQTRAESTFNIDTSAQYTYRRVLSVICRAVTTTA